VSAVAPALTIKPLARRLPEGRRTGLADRPRQGEAVVHETVLAARAFSASGRGPPEGPAMIKTPISLLERLRQPASQEAWERFVELYSPLIYAWGRRVGLQDQDAADLVQDVLVTLVKAMPAFVYDRHRSFRAWLRTVTLNRWRDACKRQGRVVPGGQAALAGAAVPDNVQAFWEAEYRQHLMNRALQVLQADFKPTTWKAFWEQAVVGRPAAEVAAELGLTPGAVYAARFRVLDRLRRELAGLLE
jgi:RNA polymerase sigma-70 factor (ECF subfamily)